MDCTQKDRLGKVATWFCEKAATVRAGDVVNFFFQGHGKKNGDMVFGKRKMSTSDLRQLLHLFDENVQINIFASHCFSDSRI